MDKIKFVLLFLLTAAALLIVTGSSKDTSGYSLPSGEDNMVNRASVILNGSSFNNIHFNTTDVKAYYAAVSNITNFSITAKSGSDSIVIFIAFYGNQTGSFQWDNETGVVYLITGGSSGTAGYMSDNSGTVTIEEYGIAGNVIKGSFSGKVYEGNTNDEVTLSGSFSVKRESEQK
jgi:hypothetical protein